MPIGYHVKLIIRASIVVSNRFIPVSIGRIKTALIIWGDGINQVPRPKLAGHSTQRLTGIVDCLEHLLVLAVIHNGGIKGHR